MADETLSTVLAELGRAPEEGLRVTGIRKAIDGKREDVLDALAALRKRGLAAEDWNGRWSLTPAGRSKLRKSVVTPPRGRSLPVVHDPGPPSLHGGGGRTADESQALAIDAGVGKRLVVEAGPGFGKTDVACARVARLIEEVGVEPEAILLLSFTRTAVREMRGRIGQLVTTGRAVRGVEIRTLDSFAWRLRTGSTEVISDSQPTTFDESIAGLLSLLEDPGQDLIDYLERFDHLFVDEAQDLTGDRARLVARILGLLRSDTGFTLFVDPAQAIYGWEDESDPEEPDWTWSDLLAHLDPAPQTLRLSTLHRTRDASLRALLLSARSLILDPTEEARDARVRSALEARATTERQAIGHCVEALRELNVDDDTFILFRTRGEALDASSWLAGSPAVPHRLRFGGLPQLAAPWIGVAVNELWVRHRRPLVVRAEFDAAWEAIPRSRNAQGWSGEMSWATLRRMGPVRGQRHSLDLARVADRLAMNQLPDELFLKDIGPAGPVVGTIHGSKGRESNTVVLALRDDAPDDADKALYEGRVLYVALSRAKEKLHVARVTRPRWSHLQSGRVWKYSAKSGTALRLEIGRAGDIDHVHAPATMSPEGFRRQQDWLGAFDGQIVDLVGESMPWDDWRWHLSTTEEDGGGKIVNLGPLSQHVSHEMWLALKAVEKRFGKRLKPKGSMKYVRMLDVTAVAVRRDAPLPASLPEPWRSSRIWLSPVVSGLARIQLWNRSYR